MKQVLVIDDQPEITGLIKEHLSDNRVTERHNPLEFKEYIIKEEFDFFIIDLDLGKYGNGYNLIKDIANLKKSGKIIVYSAMSSSKNSELLTEVDYVIEKPDFKKLKLIINRPTSVKEMSGEDVFKMMVSTYHHHFRNKLTVIQGKLPDGDPRNIQKNIDYLVTLLNDIELNKLDVASYSGKLDGFLLDYSIKKN